MSADKDDAGLAHRSAILTLLRAGGTATRGDIARRLRITRSTVSAVLQDLLAEGAVVRVRTDRDERVGRGRPAEILMLDPSAVQQVGLDFAHGRVLAVMTNASKEIIAHAQSPYPERTPWERRCAIAIELMTQSAQSNGIHLQRLRGIGIGLPGPNSATWSVGKAARTPEEYALVSSKVREVFASLFHVPVLVDHHIRFAALAESAWNRPHRADNLLYLRLSHGVGGAVVSDGHVLRGAQQLAGEMGHMRVRSDSDARLCRCGQRGCLETVASIDALVGDAVARGANVKSLTDLHNQLSTRTNGPVRDALRTAAFETGRSLGMIGVATDPHEIVLAGDIATLDPQFIDDVRVQIHREWMPNVTPPNVRLARIGEESGALGAIEALLSRTTALSKPTPGGPDEL